VTPKKRLGEMLIDAGVIGETQLKAALGHQRQWGVRLGQALVDLKLATEADIVRALSVKFGFPVAQLAGPKLEPYALEQALKMLPREFAVRYNVFPMAADTASLTVAMSDPTNLAVIDDISFRTGRRVKVCMGGDREIAEAVRRHYPVGDAEVEAIALDLDADEGQSEAVFDPFGGGSKDALDAFFGQYEGSAMPHAAAAPAPAATAQAPAAVPASRAGRAPVSPAPPAAAKPSPAAAPPRAAAGAPARPAPAPAPAPRGPLAAPAKPAPAARAPKPVNPSPARPAAPVSARPTPTPAPAAAAAAPRPAAPGPQPRAAAPEPVELELDAPVEPLAELAFDIAPADVAPFPEGVPPAEPVLASDLAPEDSAGVERASRPLTPDETAILDALERLADGHHAEPDIVKPTQAMAALVRLLLRKRIILKQEFLDELRKK
jgi:hypothetical protein